MLWEIVTAVDATAVVLAVAGRGGNRDGELQRGHVAAEHFIMSLCRPM